MALDFRAVPLVPDWSKVGLTPAFDSCNLALILPDGAIMVSKVLAELV